MHAKCQLPVSVLDSKPGPMSRMCKRLKIAREHSGSCKSPIVKVFLSVLFLITKCSFGISYAVSNTQAYVESVSVAVFSRLTENVFAQSRVLRKVSVNLFVFCG